MVSSVDKKGFVLLVLLKVPISVEGQPLVATTKSLRVYPVHTGQYHKTPLQFQAIWPTALRLWMMFMRNKGGNL